MNIPFRKYHGLGNDFILIDNRGQAELPLSLEQVKFYCDRHFGIGADGVIFLDRSESGYGMRIINSDGSECEMCGNGIRCLAQFMADLGIATTGADQYFIHTLAGVIVPQFQDGRITVDMGEPRLLCAQIPSTLRAETEKAIAVPLTVADREWLVTLVSMGNPHCITFVEDIDSIPYTEIGPQFEHHSAFPQRINTEFVQVIDRNHVIMRVWERGAGATLACGTGACAVVVAGVLERLVDRQCTVHLLGGDLSIHWLESNNRVMMTGSATFVYQGEISLGV